MLDHILLGCNDLDAGIAFVEEHTGVRPVFGGVHPGRGTRNALLSFGQRHYLEVIAPDPKQNSTESYAAQQLAEIKSLPAPRLIGWAVHVADLDALIQKIKAAGTAVHGPFPGSRAKPDGRVLKWKTAALADDHHGVLPFFIEWSADSVHPSVDAPAGCSLESFSIADANPGDLSKIFEQLGIEVRVEPGEKSELRARFRGAKGKLEVSS
jgi:catechol 2,3-dioxygenase-like lactoylglutathione lyase family enzyme